MTIALAAALLLFAACVRAFNWATGNLVTRQERYEATRDDAAGGRPTATYETSRRLDLF